MNAASGPVLKKTVTASESVNGIPLRESCDSCERQCRHSVKYSIVNLFLCFGWDESFSCQRVEIRWTCKF